MSWNPLAEASLLFCGFVMLLFLGSLVLPGRKQVGALLPNGERPLYRLNGFLLFLLLVAAVVLGTFTFGLSLSVIYHRFWEIFAVANIVSFVASFWLYAKAKDKGPSFLKDYWYGAEFNPTLMGVDLKLFAYRPSLMGLALINAAFAYLQYERYGHVTLAMALYQSMTLFYLLSSFEYENGLLSMFDMIEEKFGFMLVWGDLVLVPFFYCIPGYFLIEQSHDLPLWAAVALVALYITGFWLFRGANAQKNRFKANPDARIWGRRAETLEGRLLISGFWGIGRKLNYTGEILIYLSWTMLNGFQSPWPYLLPLWLASLLTHRARRDDRRCRSKYGELWDRYCERVRFRMFPFLY